MRPPATLAMLALLGAAPAAADMVYDVSLTVGKASATGTITTDGTIGTLATPNILDYAVEIADPSNIFSFTPANSQAVVLGGAFSATTAGLFFDHAGNNSAFYIIDGPAENAICLEAVGVGCTFGGPSKLILFAEAGYMVSASGVTRVATAPGIVSAPAPASVAVLLVGLAGLGVARRPTRRES
ncbi:hypothetical protein [Roseomonas sp. AR75]|uniref:hypothetical protein n=1 Tax=Roseomonas sp. AR75 TaxID=2562311 RepID=UPI0010BF804F|nr:hypothetical protein [Roseomonas sp. AR75]